jgi:hypothetical protein
MKSRLRSCSCSCLAWLALAWLGACEFDPYGAPLPLAADASLPIFDAQVGDPDAPLAADARPELPDAAPPDAAPVDASACTVGGAVVPLEPGVIQSGTTFGQASGLSGGNTCGGATAGEDVFSFELDERADVTVSTALAGTAFNTALYVRTDCADPSTQIDCASQAALGDVLSLPNLEPGSYAAIVDGFGSASGSYQVRLTVRPIRGQGMPCDPFGEASRCDSGLACVASDAAGHGVCVPAGSSCIGSATSVVLGAAGTNVQHGVTAGVSGYAPHCAATGSGPERVLHAVVAAGEARDLVLDVRSTGALDPIAEISTQCELASSSLACTAASRGAGTSELAVVDDVAPGEYFAVVDGSNGTSGGFDADLYLRPVRAAGAACDRQVRADRCGGTSVCVDTDDIDGEPSCAMGVPVRPESGGDHASCEHADGPEVDDFSYAATMDAAGTPDVVEIRPSPITSRIVVSVLGEGGTCPVDLALTLAQGECGELTTIASSDDEGLGACPYIDTDVPFDGRDPLWLTITRASNFGSASYTMVVDFIP